MSDAAPDPTSEEIRAISEALRIMLHGDAMTADGEANAAPSDGRWGVVYERGKASHEKVIDQVEALAAFYGQSIIHIVNPNLSRVGQALQFAAEGMSLRDQMIAQAQQQLATRGRAQREADLTARRALLHLEQMYAARPSLKPPEWLAEDLARTAPEES